jgi:hypothetical protein
VVASEVEEIAGLHGNPLEVVDKEQHTDYNWEEAPVYHAYSEEGRKVLQDHIAQADQDDAMVASDDNAVAVAVAHGNDQDHNNDAVEETALMMEAAPLAHHALHGEEEKDLFPVGTKDSSLGEIVVEVMGAEKDATILKKTCSCGTPSALVATAWKLVRNDHPSHQFLLFEIPFPIHLDFHLLFPIQVWNFYLLWERFALSPRKQRRSLRSATVASLHSLSSF